MALQVVLEGLVQAGQFGLQAVQKGLDGGLRDGVCRDNLLKSPDACGQEPAARPQVPLVAEYTKVRLWSESAWTPGNVVSFTLQVMAAIWLLNEVVGIPHTGSDEATNQTGNWLVAIASYIPLVGFLITAMLGAVALFWRMTKKRGPLRLNLMELSLTLPTGICHTPWCDVHSVTIPAARRWRWRENRRIRVELDDGTVAVLWIPNAAERQELVGIMQQLILCHRKVDYWPQSGAAMSVNSTSDD